MGGDCHAGTPFLRTGRGRDSVGLAELGPMWEAAPERRPLESCGGYFVFFVLVLPAAFFVPIGVFGLVGMTEIVN